MRKIFLFFLGLWLSCGYAQSTVYKYYIYLTDHRLAHPLTESGGMMQYSGSDMTDTAFFANYQILQYRQAFPKAIDTAVRNIYYVETYDSSLPGDLISGYPAIYVSFEDITNVMIEFLDYYPNDYGSTSPVTNLGADGSRKDLDYINAPKAWDISKGSSKVKIGINDTAINIALPDLLNKVTLVPGTSTTTANSHGTSVAALAAATGNNGTGTVGVCMNCEIIASGMGIGGSSADVFSVLYDMAEMGARVINFSWTNSGYVNNGHGFINAEQMVINDMTNNLKVALVAAAGNHPSFGTPTSYAYPNQYGELFVYPASYDNVISVSTIQHQYPITVPLVNDLSAPSYCCYNSANGMYLHTYLEDSVTIDVNAEDPYNPVAVNRNGYNLAPYNPEGFQPSNHTLNSKVDLLAPGRGIFMYSNFGVDGSIYYANGTSFAAPLVAGTIGLMISVNDCLLPSEADVVLKLTSADIEHMPLNANFMGFVGAGKLETGDAVVFVNEMGKPNGNAKIDNHIFSRFNLKLENINNKLTIENTTFDQNAVVDFKARNEIRLLPGTTLQPGGDGHTYLSIDPAIVMTCDPVSQRTSSGGENNTGTKNMGVILSPNPNNGSFGLYNLGAVFNSKTIQIHVTDVNGRNLFNKTIAENEFEGCQVNLEHLSAGIYIIKLSSPSHSEQIKFVKK